MLQYIKNVATLELDKDKCTGCTMCVQVCPHDVFEMKGLKVEIINLDGCMECGACAVNCPFSALTVSPGVGCAYAIIKGMITNSEPNCDCDDSSCC